MTPNCDGKKLMCPRRDFLEAENARLRQALSDVVNPLDNLQRYAESKNAKLNGSAYSIANNLGFVQRIARDALQPLT